MYGISIHQLYTITTDNASNMQKMIKLLGSQQLVDIIQEEDVTEHSDEDDADAHMVTWNESDDFSDIVLSEPYEFSADAEGSSDTEINVRNYTGHPVAISSPEYNVRSISCAAHTLQLAIGDAFKSCALGETIENARKLVKKLRTPTLKRILKAMKRRKPIIDCVTRWNSTVDMLERLLEFHDICETNEELHMPQEAWTEIKSIVQTLTPCRVATKNLQREQLTFGDLYKEWTCCILRTQKFGTTLSEALVRAMKAREKQLFQSEPFLAGMFMDTRFIIIRAGNDESYDLYSKDMASYTESEKKHKRRYNI
ncbi:hypothetical protein ALC57_06480 [Trachymyrmex cornetzi]|uniref:Zinc finger BED domain-containing protein 4 n=1 Tax=Trachymyrmex cornetzi TaxID=471704 RepID=A0A151J8T1_9HYME|nr:hypothetical protein ALC57_06480 [Trachymyrmex cornetzi]